MHECCRFENLTRLSGKTKRHPSSFQEPGQPEKANKRQLHFFWKWLEKSPVVYKQVGAEQKEHLTELTYKIIIHNEEKKDSV